MPQSSCRCVGHGDIMMGLGLFGDVVLALGGNGFGDAESRSLQGGPAVLVLTIYVDLAVQVSLWGRGGRAKGKTSVTLRDR